MSLRTASPALAAALLFGASTPLSKTLTGAISPLLLAGLLYLGSGIGLGIVLALRRAFWGAQQDAPTMPAIPSREIPWLLGAILAGGVAGPALLMTGLVATSAASASLLLNVEGVFTALIAWEVFKENTAIFAHPPKTEILPRILAGQGFPGSVADKIAHRTMLQLGN